MIHCSLCFTIMKHYIEHGYWKYHYGSQYEKGGLFSLNVCEATSKDARVLQAASATNRREFWRETRTLLWLLIERIIFLSRDKTSFVILIGCIVVFTYKKHRSLL